jgi:hypothetical protein
MSLAFGGKTMNRTINRIETVLSLPAVLLRLEGLAIFFGAIAVYIGQGASGLLFGLLFLAPDLSLVAYRINPRVGSYTYNAVHTYALPAVLMALSFAAQWTPGIHIALIWFAHIGMDRMLGFGLKYPTQFKDTHLQRV